MGKFTSLLCTRLSLVPFALSLSKGLAVDNRVVRQAHHQRIKILIAAGLLILIGLTANLQAEEQQPSLPDIMNEYVDDALRSNLSLQGQDAQLLQARALLDEARSRYWPSVALAARYTVNDGGRTLDFPVGDLLNPVYSTLNEMLVADGQAPRFAPLANQQIPLLRSREQDTHLELRQPLYSPAISAASAANQAMVQSVEQQRLGLRQELKRDVRVAYLGWLQARAALLIVQSSQTVLAENLRINQSLFDNGKVTQDQPLRARAELLGVEQQHQAAENQVNQAQRWLNFLRNQPLDAPLRAPASETLTQPSQNELLIEPTPNTTGKTIDRAELRQLDAAVAAASAQVDLAAAAAKPSVSLGVDAGIQGDKYGFGPDYNYVSGSLLLNWKFYAGGGMRAAVNAARAGERRLQLQREQLAAQIQLQVAQSEDRYRTAIKSYATSQARVEAASAAWRIAERKRNEGVINQVEYLDARNAMTTAELDLNVARFATQIEWAQWQFALGGS